MKIMEQRYVPDGTLPLHANFSHLRRKNFALVSGRSRHWMKSKNPAAPAVKRRDGFACTSKTRQTIPAASSWRTSSLPRLSNGRVSGRWVYGSSAGVAKHPGSEPRHHHEDHERDRCRHRSNSLRDAPAPTLFLDSSFFRPKKIPASSAGI
jgi:hypothetical protein